MNLPLCSKAAAMLFQTLSLAILSLHAFLLGSYITGKLRTQSINFSSNSCLQLIVYKKYKHQLLWQYFCIVSQKLVQMPQSHDAAALAQRPGATLMSILDDVLMSVAFKNHTPLKLVLWLQRAASRVCKRHCMVVKNHTLSDSNYTSTKN